MICKKCGGEINVGEKFCQRCGNPVETQQQTDSNYNAGAYDPNTYSAQPNNINAACNNQNKVSVSDIPFEYKPISMWGYFGYEILFSIPVVGFIFFAIKKKDKNENKKSFAKAGFTINLILSVVILLIAGSVLYFAFGGKITMPKKTAKITAESIEETREAESSSVARTTSVAVSSTAATSPVKKTESVKSFSYNKNSKAFTFELNGNTFKYPVAAASIKDLGYIYVSNTLSSETATLDMYMDAYKSTVMIKYNTKAGNTSDCYAIAVELKEGSTFMGLSTAATYATVKEAFKDADTEVTSDYKSDTATGILQYMYGDRIISVTLDNGYVTGASIQ